MNRFTFMTTLAALALGIGNVSASDFPKGSPKFETHYKAALAEGKKSGKPVLLIFSAVWCGPCQKMKHDVYPSTTIQPYHDKFVWAYLDADEAANAKPQQKYGVNGIPHIEFVDGEGKSLGQHVGSTSPEKFATVLDGILAKAPAKDAKTDDTKKPLGLTPKAK